MPTQIQIQIASLGLIIALLAFGQKIGAFKSERIGKAFVTLAVALFVAWMFLFYPGWPAWGLVAVLLVWVASWLKKWMGARSPVVADDSPKLAENAAYVTGEITEAFFQDCLSGARAENISDSFITLHVHVVNQSPMQATIKGWDLRIESRGRIYATQKEGSLERFVVDRYIPGTGISAALSMKPEALEPFESIVKNRPLVYGSGIDGWMRFVITDPDFNPTDFEGRYTLTLIDSIGDRHLIVREPGPWPKTGTIRER